ncbi:helix-turn-helix domain-containing protein [Pistricoccus aurantiacus]|uniref:helix-turn-helix domain-containing protein n=1 Tax=Pistricoccus aurantiacus TaxID=1883414 RepID=UPI00363C3EC7
MFIEAEIRALAANASLEALNRVVLHGITLAQLGEFVQAKRFLRRAARAFGSKDIVARSRCIVAESEIALVSRNLGQPVESLEKAIATFEKHGDWTNAAHARYLKAQCLLLIGHLDEAEWTLADIDSTSLPPVLRVTHELMVAEIAIRRLRARTARTSLAWAMRAAHESGIPALSAVVENASRALDTPAARLIAQGKERLLLLEEVEALLASDTLVVDACQHIVRSEDMRVSLQRRPVLFSLAYALGEAWPGDVNRDALVARAFRARLADDSYRARLRVEVGRLRTALRPLADVCTTRRGFALAPRHESEIVVVLGPLIEEQHASILALLADGEAWPSSALALALGTSQRTVQRALDALATAGKVQSVGRGRARRWMTPAVPGFTTTLLLPRAITRRVG